MASSLRVTSQPLVLDDHRRRVLLDHLEAIRHLLEGEPGAQRLDPLRVEIHQTEQLPEVLEERVGVVRVHRPPLEEHLRDVAGGAVRAARHAALDRPEDDDPPRPSLPSRLQRPAACTTRSSGPNARSTSGKSRSTPASTTCVLTTRHGSPFFRRSRITSSTSRRCAPQRSVERCRTSASPSSPSACNSASASGLVLTTASPCRLARSSSATRGQSHGSVGHSYSTRRSARKRRGGSGAISCTRGNSAKPGASSKAGCVAVQRTTLAP